MSGSKWIIGDLSWIEAMEPESFPEPYKSVAELIGVKNLVALYKTFRGDTLYFKELDQCFLDLRNERIKAEFDGGNHGDIGRKYNLSARRIYQILSGVPTIVENDDQQLMMF